MAPLATRTGAVAAHCSGGSGARAGAPHRQRRPGAWPFTGRVSPLRQPPSSSNPSTPRASALRSFMAPPRLRPRVPNSAQRARAPAGLTHPERSSRARCRRVRRTEVARDSCKEEGVAPVRTASRVSSVDHASPRMLTIPGRVTRRIACSPPTATANSPRSGSTGEDCRPYTSSLPGDQSSGPNGPSASFVSAPSSSSKMYNTSRPSGVGCSAPSCRNAMWVPSGDQAGAPSAPSATSVRFEPSALTT